MDIPPPIPGRHRPLDDADQLPRGEDGFAPAMGDDRRSDLRRRLEQLLKYLLAELPRDAAENPVDDLFADGRDIVRGYLRRADLTDEELALIPHLTMARVVVRALITTRRAQLFPHNVRYIMRNTEQGWAQLDWFLARTVDQISATFAH